MATVSCTINGFKYYNGGWIPSSGFSTANSSVSGYGGQSYTAVYKFTISSIGSSTGTISFNLPWIDGGFYNYFSVNYYITQSDVNSSSSSVQGTVLTSGSVSDDGSWSSQWKTKSFTTNSFSFSAGTYYLYLTGGSMAAEFGGHLTATANYTPNTYTVTYNANGGSWAPSAQTKTYGVALTLSQSWAVRTGYTFKGWSTSANGAIAYYAGSSYTANANITLYAVWEENYLTVYYYSNYATEAYSGAENAVGANRNVVVRTAYFYYDDAYPNGHYDWTYSGAGTYLARTGYVATGNWGTSTSGGTLVGQLTSYSSGQALAEALGKSLKNGNASINLYAQWQGNAYTASYNANGGSVNPSSDTFYYSTTITGMPTPTRDNYYFDYWYVNFDGTNCLNLGRHYMYTDKISVHIEAYMDNWADYHNSSMRLISCTESGGWNIESSNSYINFACYDDGYGYKSATSSKTWSSLSSGWHSFDLVFDGSKVHGYIDEVESATSATYTSGRIGYNNANNSIFVGAEAGTGTTPVGQYFVGKVRNVVITNSGTRNTSANGKFIAPMHDFTLEASWTKNTYNIYLDGNGGTVPWAVKSVGAGDVIILPTVEQCSRINYELLGFDPSDTATTATYAAGSTYTPTGAATLYAIWKPKGILRIGDQTYTPYVYYNGAWVQAVPYAYVDDEWKIGG